MNLDGIWGGNMFAGGSGAILPNKITSKHNFRYCANMTGSDIAAKLRKFSTSSVTRMSRCTSSVTCRGRRRIRTTISRSRTPTRPIFDIGQMRRPNDSISGRRWRRLLAGLSVLWARRSTVDLPISSARGGTGGNAHAANEWYVIEGAGNQLGMASAEKIVVTALYNYAGLNGPIALKATKSGAGGGE